MPLTKKTKKSPPVECKKLVQPALTDVVAVLQENIRLKAKEVREPIKTGKAGPSTSGRKAVAIPVEKPGPSSSKTVNDIEVKLGPSSSTRDVAPADNPYAREIFFCKTNVREIARQAVKEQKNYTDPAQIKAAAKDFRYRLFRTYVEKPNFRIREPLHKLRFESEYYEYRLHLALSMGLQSDEDYQDYKEKLDAAGVSESWVQMDKDNLLLVHERKVLRKVQAGFEHWGAKLVKLPEYLLQAQRNYEAKHQAKAANRLPEPDPDPLLDALMNRSNARERLVDIKELHDFLATNPPRFVCYRSLRWLVFEDDALNQRFGLGPHADDASQDGEEDDHETESETMIGITALDRSSNEADSVHSENSEFAQLRSEMATTQPDEMVPNVGVPFFQNTEEVITVLEPTQQRESFAAVPVDPLLPPDDPVVPSVAFPLISPKGPLDDPLVANKPEDVTKQDEPMPQQPETSTSAAATNVPGGHIQSSGEEGSEFSLLTPGQQEVISISDDEDDDNAEAHQHRSEANRSSNSLSDEIKLEDGFWADVDNLKRYTNINEFVASAIRLRFKGNQQKIERRMAKLDKYVMNFVEENIDQFRKNVLPEGVVKLTRRARREREAVSKSLMQQASVVQPPPDPTPSQATKSPPAAAPATVTTTMQSPPIPAPMSMQSPPVVSTLEPLFNGALPSESQLDTPRLPVPTKIRRIAYEDSPDSMPMPDSDNFQPEVHSTQNAFGGPMIGAALYPGTPRPSPQKQQQTLPRARRSLRNSPQQRPSVEDRSSTPFADENLNDTVQKQSPRKRPSPQVKAEPNNSGYEGEVEEVPINDDPIELEDTQSESQIDAMALIERADGFGVPSRMRNRMDRLFKNQNFDVTQSSQSSENDGSGGGRRLSLDRQSLGFQSSQSSRVPSD